VIRHVTPEAPQMAALRTLARAEGFMMLERLADEWTSDANRFSGEGEAYLGVYAGDRLCAVGGVHRDPYAGGEGAGRIRHLYVLPDARRAGHGSQLLSALLTIARPMFGTLRLRTGNPAAAALYEAHGFVPISGPFATHIFMATD
jgi:GNAT superfamily N-acetyltransferase